MQHAYSANRVRAGGASPALLVACSRLYSYISSDSSWKKKKNEGKLTRTPWKRPCSFYKCAAFAVGCIRFSFISRPLCETPYGWAVCVRESARVCYRFVQRSKRDECKNGCSLSISITAGTFPPDSTNDIRTPLAAARIIIPSETVR